MLRLQRPPAGDEMVVNIQMVLVGGKLLFHRFNRLIRLVGRLAQDARVQRGRVRLDGAQHLPQVQPAQLLVVLGPGADGDLEDLVLDVDEACVAHQSAIAGGRAGSMLSIQPSWSCISICPPGFRAVKYCRNCAIC